MTDVCEHVGKRHPLFFQCLDCEDTAFLCNCNSCSGVFCELCQEIIWVDCDEIVRQWYKQYPDKDLETEGFKIQIKKFQSSASKVSKNGE